MSDDKSYNRGMDNNKFVSFRNSVLTATKLLFDRRVPIWKKSIPIIAVFYILSPIDIVPDFLVGPGLLDDLGIFMFSLYVFYKLIPKKVLDQYIGNKDITDKTRKKKPKIEEGEFEEISK